MSAGNPYNEYLTRWEQLVGQVPVGSYGKWKGKMVKKLAPAEFLGKLDEYTQLHSHYQKVIERGDTINDTMVKLLRERATELLLEEK